MNPAEVVLKRTSVYRLGQAPFAARKLAPVLRHNDLRAVHRVLDIDVARSPDEGGSARILDLVLPEERISEPYALTLFGVPLWNMVYCRGQARR